MSSAPTAWLEQTPEGVIVRLLIQPKASRSEIVGLHGDPPRLKIRIAAPPVDGAANEEVIRFLKKLLKVPASSIRIIRGESSKHKTVLCSELQIDQAARLLLAQQAP